MQGTSGFASASVALGFVGTGCDDLVSLLLTLKLACGHYLPSADAYEQLDINYDAVDSDLRFAFEGDMVILWTLSFGLRVIMVRRSSVAHILLPLSSIILFCSSLGRFAYVLQM